MQATRLLARTLLQQAVHQSRPSMLCSLRPIWNVARDNPGVVGVRSVRTELRLTEAGHPFRAYATEADYQKEIDVINSKFTEARDEIEDAAEDAETVYFNESAEGARELVQETLDLWKDLLGKVDEDIKGKLQRSMGLKMEQLKAEVKQLDHLHDD
eukprot:CAMPEP_0198197838 /NCGR_PEP_ID=MMETSP1445-20131203/1406_1 /TAXON_ID=36898 /ORGANISM="Pyramimonas sp., Strain CCMP2087" /LENGTH=155 /DNA_ID=CAMNT_0043867239 /DNA_START=59 /DNA_END=526 /DNA_ORIENTATION=-